MTQRYQAQTAQQVGKSLDKHLREFKRALGEEIDAVRSGGGQKTYLSDGYYLGMRGGWHIYSFTSDAELRFPDDTPVDLEYQDRRHEGLILSTDGFDVILALQEQIGDSIATAILYTAPWFLLQKLQERLVELGERPLREVVLAEQLLQQGFPTVPPDRARARDLLNQVGKQRGKLLTCNAYQLEAVGAILANQATFVWGPPGTGKTKALGLTAAALVQASESLLVVAHSNVAVDVAMEALAHNLAHSPAYSSGKVLRYGVTYLPGLDAFPWLHPRSVVRQQNRELVDAIERLEKERQELVRQSRLKGSQGQKQAINDQIAGIKKSLEPLRDQLRQEESELIRQASVVGCTLSKASIAPEVYERRFDAVLIDEASMAYIPHCAFVAGLATRRVAVFGDFRQLPPISQANTDFARCWLQRDIFDQAGIITRVDRRQADGRLVLLPIQYRMHPDIAAVPNRLFYGGQLRDAPQLARQTAPIVQRQPAPGKSLAVYDITPLAAHCFRERESHSRFNPISALAAVELAYWATQAGHREIGIITPYNAQSRLIHRLLKDLELPAEQVRVATVHSFQGSERDLILFDTTEGPAGKPGLLVQGGMGSTAMRLANVAISRARGKFIALVNYDYVRARLSADDSFRQLVDHLTQATQVTRVNWSEQKGHGLWATGLPGLDYYPNGRVARDEIESDLCQAGEEIAIAWPTTLAGFHFSPSILKRCDPSRVRFFATGGGSGHFHVGLDNAQIWDSRSRVPMGLVGVDRECLWLYLNPESPSGQVLRLSFPNATKLLYAFWRLVPEDEVRQETLEERLEKGKSPIGMPCPQCGGALWPKTGRYSPYLACTGSCGYTKRITPRDATNLARFMGIICGCCGGQVQGRKGYKGVFLGCADYPECDWTQDLDAII